MERYHVTFHPAGHQILAAPGTTIWAAARELGLVLEAPCGGHGTCGKCRVAVQQNGETRSVLACQTAVEDGMVVTLPNTAGAEKILTEGTTARKIQPDTAPGFRAAVDLGSTTVVCYLMDPAGTVVTKASCANPQQQYGADIITRIHYVLAHGEAELTSCIRQAVSGLLEQVCRTADIVTDELRVVSVAGNPCMHHFFLGIAPDSLVTPPYMPATGKALLLSSGQIFPQIPNGELRILPNIAGFVGGDMAACILAAELDRREENILLLDIGTNGELILGNRERRVACSTAAGPALEGAKITCGMRGVPGAIDHVRLVEGDIAYTTIDGVSPVGICGSGLLDLIAVLLDAGVLTEMGRMEKPENITSAKLRARLVQRNGLNSFTLCEDAQGAIYLTEQDIQEVQLAKGAIAAGIELLMRKMELSFDGISRVLLAGAFGNYITPASACRIGMIPRPLENKILPIGNAAGEGAKLVACSRSAFADAEHAARETEFLELASFPDFEDCFVDHLEFGDAE